MVTRFVAVLALAPLGVAQVQLEFSPPLDLHYQTVVTYTRVVQLPDGDRLFVGSYGALGSFGLYDPMSRHSQIALTAVGPVPFQGGEPSDVLPVLGGSGNDIPQDAAVDLSGNIWIVGNTDSDDFNLVNPIVPRKVPYRTASFVLELDPTGTKLLFASYLCGQAPSIPFALGAYASYATAITIDRAGSIYVGGSTNEYDFPVTPGALPFSPTHPPGIGFGNDTFFYSFLVKIDPAGKLIYSAMTGTGTSNCQGGSACLGKMSTSASVDGLAVDTSGAVTMSGVKSPGFGYISRVAPDGSKLVWSASFGHDYGYTSNLLLAQDPAGNLNLFGAYRAFVQYPPPYSPPLAGAPGLFAAKLSADGATILYSTDLGQSPDVHAAGIALDASGNPYLAGTSSSAQFPILPGVPNLGADFVLRLDSTGAKPQRLFRFPAGTATLTPSFNPDGQILVPSSQGSVLTLSPDYAFDTAAIVGFANSASSELNTLYPGELVSLIGFKLPSTAQEVSVLVGGIPAPVLYAGPNQINVQVPFKTAQYNPHDVQVVLPSGTISLQPRFQQSIGIFTTDGVLAAALNQDGSINSASNPAPFGTIVSLFGTGATWPTDTQDGALATAAAPLDVPPNAFEILDKFGEPAGIVYAGPSPGTINGVFQLNVQLLPSLNQPITLRKIAINSNDVALSSNPVEVYLK